MGTKTHAPIYLIAEVRRSTGDIQVTAVGLREHFARSSAGGNVTLTLPVELVGLETEFMDTRDSGTFCKTELCLIAALARQHAAIFDGHVLEPGGARW